MILDSLFTEITYILLLAAVLGAVGLKLRQPLIVSFIAVGVLAGPSVLSIVTSHEQIELLAEMGIALLLFIVGLKLDVGMIRTMGPVALATGLGQVAFTSIFGFFIALGLGMTIIHAVYVAVALTFSSTIIIVKLLSDKKEIDALHGRIAVGFLIVQDIVVVLVMIGLSTLGVGDSDQVNLTAAMLWVAAKGLLFLGSVILLMRYVLPYVLDQLARSQELMVLFAVAWSVFLAMVGDYLGFSKEVGAFLAGISLASTQYRDALSSRLATLRDFLLLFFFIDLGARLDLSVLGAQLGNALIFSIFVLIGNPLIVMIIMGFMGYRKRTGFLAGLTVAQISEFSLILGALGVSLGHLNQETMGMITLVGLVTIGLSTYMILYSGPIYKIISPVLSIFEKKSPYREMETSSLDSGPIVDVLLLGLGTYGGSILNSLLQRKKQVVGVDFDPQVLNHWRQKGVSVLYGDAGDPEILEHLPTKSAHWVVSAMPDREANLALLRVLKQTGYRGKIVLTARSQADADEFRSSGADVVLRPFADAAEQAVDSLTAAMRLLPEKMAWPTTLREVRLEAGSVFSGKSIGQIPLRAETGVSILAVSRAGKSYFDPGPDFQLFPGDRLVLLGASDNLKRAVEYLKRRDFGPEDDQYDGFTIGSVEVKPDSPWVDQTLASLNFRRDYGVTVIGIQRGDLQITGPSAQEAIRAGDVLIVAGNKTAVKALQV